MTLPPLPETLKILYCHSNQLTSLPPLPKTLKKLYCGINKLSSLPPLPETLETLFCHFNQLTSLPPLPETLKELSCQFNQLTTLPDLPWGLQNIEEEKLNHHNKKRIDLGMETIKSLPDRETWDRINEMWVYWVYRIGGEKYNEAVIALKN
jgi:Leucine-rich repeat (LRR) protein